MSVNTSATLSIEINTDKAKQSLAELQTAFERLGVTNSSSLSNALTKDLEKVNSVNAALRQKITELNQQVMTLTDRMKTISVEAQSTAVAISGSLSGATTRVKKDLDSMGDKFKSTTEKLISEKDRLARAGVDFGSLAKGIQSASKVDPENINSLRKYISTLEEARAVLNKTRSQIGGVGAPELVKQKFGSNILDEIKNLDKYKEGLAAIVAAEARREDVQARWDARRQARAAAEREQAAASEYLLSVQLKSAEMTGNAQVKAYEAAARARANADKKAADESIASAKRVADAFDDLSKRSKVNGSGMQSRVEALTVMPAQLAGMSQYYAALEKSLPVLEAVRASEEKWAASSSQRVRDSVAAITASNGSLRAMADFYRQQEVADNVAIANRLTKIQEAEQKEADIRLRNAMRVASEREKIERDSAREYTTWWASELEKRDKEYAASVTKSVQYLKMQDGEEQKSMAQRLKMIASTLNAKKEYEENYTSWWASELQKRDKEYEQSIRTSIQYLKMQEDENKKAANERLKIIKATLDAQKEKEREYTSWWESELNRRNQATLRNVERRSAFQTVNAERIDRQLGIGQGPSPVTRDYLMYGATPANRGGSMLAQLEAEAAAKWAAEDSAKKLAEANGAVAKSHSITGAAAAKHEQHIRGFTKSQWEAHSAARGLLGGLNALWLTYGSTGPLMAGAAISSSFVQATKAGSEFAYQLKFVQALGGETSEEVKRVGDAALELATRSMYGPVELANGLRILAQAGLNANEAMKALPETLNLATVGEMNMEQAATTLAGVMNAFSLTVDDMPHIGDVFAKAAAMSQTSVQGMTEAMKTASVVGEQYGASMEDTATALTLLAKVNITGTAAGTAFRNMVKELYAPVPQAAAAMRKLGLETKDAQGNLKPFADVIYDLKGKLEQFDKAGQVQILQRLFGERGAKEAIAMLALTREEWVKMRDEIADSKGFMQGVSDKLKEEVKGQWKEATNTLQAELIKAYQAAEPTVLEAVKSFKNLVSSEEFVSGLRSIVSGVATLTKTLADLAPFLITAGKAWLTYKAAMIGASVWGAVSTAIVGTATALSALVNVTGPGLSAMALLRGSIGGLGASLALIPTPLTMIGGLLAGGVTAWALWGAGAETAITKLRKQLEDLEKSLGDVNTMINDIRLDKVGRDISTRQVLDGFKVLNAEVEKYQKSLEDQLGGKIELDLEFNIKGEGPSRLRVESMPEFNQARMKLLEMRRRLNEAMELNADRSQGENGELDLVSGGKPKPKPKLDVDGILGKDGGSGRGDSKAIKDWRSKFNDTLSSDLKQEQLRLETEQIRIEELLADRLILSSEATERKNAAAERSLLTQQQIIAAAYAEAAVKGDEVSRVKTFNDLKEIEIKIDKQREQTGLDVVKARSAEALQLADIRQAVNDAAEDRKFELEMIGKTKAEIEALTAARAIERKYRDLTKDSEGKAKVRPEQASLLDGQKKLELEAIQRNKENQDSFVYGWTKAYGEYAANATTAAMVGKTAFESMSNGMTNMIDEFAKTGTINFKRFAYSVVSDIQMMLTKMLAMQAMKAMFGGSASGGSGFLGMAINFGLGMMGGETAIATGQAMGPPVALKSANGNAFLSDGVHRFADGGLFTNNIYDSPVNFRFANGGGFSLGQMGEAGPEAVMPLGRDSRGKLGVHLASAPQQQQTQAAPPQNNIRIVNAFDTSTIGDYIGSTEGEKVIMNVVKKNPSMIRKLASS